MINRKNVELKNIILLTAVANTNDKFFIYDSLDEEYIGHNYGKIRLTLREAIHEDRQDLIVFVAARTAISNVHEEDGHMVCNASLMHIIPIPSLSELIYIKVDRQQLSFYDNVEEKVYEDFKPTSYTLADAIDDGRIVYVTGKYNVQLYINIARIYTDEKGHQQKVLYDGGKVLHPEIAIPISVIL